MNPLDEIEMELGKESMKYVCDHSGACERKPCYHEGKHTHLSACDPPRSELKGCDHLHSKCIPVEPEYVPSPGLLQRMGMAVGPSEDGWFVGINRGLLTKSDAKKRLETFSKAFPGEDYRMFRWSDGVQG